VTSWFHGGERPETEGRRIVSREKLVMGKLIEVPLSEEQRVFLEKVSRELGGHLRGTTSQVEGERFLNW